MTSLNGSVAVGAENAQKSKGEMQRRMRGWLCTVLWVNERYLYLGPQIRKQLIPALPRRSPLKAEAGKRKREEGRREGRGGGEGGRPRGSGDFPELYLAMRGSIVEGIWFLSSVEQQQSKKASR